MIDEVDIYSRLESALFGSLVHAVGVSASVVFADVSAIRIFEGPEDALSTYVDASRLGLNGQVVQSLQAWPAADDSIFEFTRQKKLTDHAFRPPTLLDGAATDTARLFRPLESIANVSDAFCVTFPVIAPAWCMIAYIRCHPNAPFEHEQIRMLKRFKPALARVTKSGYQREIHCRSDVEIPTAPNTEVSNGKTALLLAKLSRTERLILSFLRSEATERQIAQTIHRSPHTIHVHVKNIYRKLGVNSRRMLVSLFEPER